MKEKLEEMLVYSEKGKVISGVLGILIYSIGLNLFIVPLGLYSGGLMGICQLIRTFLTSVLGLQFGSFDIAGIINYVLNVPVVILAYKVMNRIFVRKLIIILTAMSVFLSLIPIPAEPLLDDPLTGCLIGGIICGFGIGTYLRAGCSGGGFEVIGIYLTRKRNNFSVGKMSMIVNAVIYSICLVLFDVEVAIYSIIYMVFCSITMDKLHSQNILVEAIIISKTNNDLIEQNILQELHHGITHWNAHGGYTEENADVFYTVISKFEIATLKRIVYSANPQAFMVVKEGISVNGNFVKRL